ncbi:MAG: four helix bundle protein [Anaerolineae bacterium]|nr:four helix bundle protein [Anaerolineae bacterium]
MRAGGEKEKGFRKLLVWQRAHELVLFIYQLTNGFPSEEKFGLTSQLQRAAVSVPANIAEGYAYQREKQFARFLRIAQGSLAEVEYYLFLAKDLAYISEETYAKVEKLRGEVGYLLHRLIKSVQQS